MTTDGARWTTYNDAQAGRSPRPLCREVLDRAGPGAGRPAVDLGCGAGIETKVAWFEELELPPADLVHVGYALPFVHPSSFASVWGRIRGALRPGGWLAVDLFGNRDSWADNEEMTFLDRAAVDRLLAGLTVEVLDEEDADGRAFSGPSTGTCST